MAVMSLTGEHMLHMLHMLYVVLLVLHGISGRAFAAI